MNTRISPKSKTRFPCVILLMLTAMCSVGSVRADGVARLGPGRRVAGHPRRAPAKPSPPSCPAASIPISWQPRKSPIRSTAIMKRPCNGSATPTGFIADRSTSRPNCSRRDHVVLRCEGLDTLATIRLNGSQWPGPTTCSAPTSSTSRGCSSRGATLSKSASTPCCR